jgi:hypothetical protein
MSFKITVTGSHLDGFAAAELSWASPNTEVQIGRVFERPDGWKIELFADEAPLDVPLDEFVGHLQKAKGGPPSVHQSNRRKSSLRLPCRCG